ncbi:aldose 1-epimerase family protein [Desulfosporosinus sp. SB140]|uniref:aldose 1-epimerase family protein n=1 Tax=Desulfosporosinus paludis TaxID=3115649 RepID=UPI00388E4046
MFKLENEFISVEVNSKGAEMYSLKSKDDGTEFIWQADSKYWPWHAPVCFPIVGKLANNQYQVGDNTYCLNVHGFARDMEFRKIEAADDRVVYRLDYDDATLAKFPFKFLLDISYTLVGRGVIIQYNVKNADDKPICFSIGAHTGFNCPLLPDEMFSDYELVFETAETAKRLLLDDGLRSGQTELLLKNDNTLPLSRELFKKDALILKNLKSQYVTLRGRKSGKSVTVNFMGFPYMGIWTKPEEAPFVCIEPWYGVTDTTGESKRITEKEGILFLVPEQEFRCAYQIIVG